MPTAFTGSLGWTGLHPLQLGGPPLVSTWDRPLPDHAVPLLAHAYLNDGVTPAPAPATTFRVLNRPAIKVMTANGGPPQITIEVETIGQGGTLWGGFVWGGANWGGSGLGLTQGNVIRLTEVGGPYAGFVYSGIVEGFPDVRSSRATTHGILLTPFAFELTRTPTQLLYTTPTDVAQTVRDAVALTQHCFCDQVSVPPATGVLIAQNGAVDFRNQKVAQVLDLARSALGPTAYWHCDELGRVWLQTQGSGAVYTLMGGRHYDDRTSTGGDIQARINRVPAVGGVPTGGSANIQAIATGASALPGPGSIGVRTLDPPLQVPGVTDQATLNLVANGVLAALDQTWTRVMLQSTPPTFPRRVHMSQPGGAMVRYWEPGIGPMPETGAVAGYVGPFICQSVTLTEDPSGGYWQTIEAGSAPVTSQADLDALARSLVSRVSLNALQVTAAALNLPQTLTGSFQSVGGTVVNGLPAGVWVLDGNKLALYDENGVRRVAQGNLPANGVSPAGFKFEADDATGTPIFDSLGLIDVMKSLGGVLLVTPGAVYQAITAVVPASTLVTGSAITFSLVRSTTVLLLASVVANSVNQTGIIDFFIDGVSVNGIGAGNAFLWYGVGLASTTGMAFYRTELAAGSHTIDLRGAVAAGGATLNITQAYFFGFRQGH